MERDIRDLFDKNEFPKKEIPKNHREELIKKLETLDNQKNKKSSSFLFLKIVASVALIICCSYFYLTNNTSLKIEQTAVEVQIQEVEKEYLVNINKEWQNFIAVANDTVLVNKFQEKLKVLDANYKVISENFKENPNQINNLKSLIENLQRRLELIQNIKEHVKELNQKNTSNETIYL